MRVVERGSGTPIVLIHGFGVDHRVLLPLDSVLEEAGGWRRLYFDLPGTAGTPIEDVASAEDVVAAVEEEIGGRVGDDSFALLGNSFGGMIARRVAHDFRSQVLGMCVVAPLMVAEHRRRDLPARLVLCENRDVLLALGDAAEAFADMAVNQSTHSADAFMQYVYPGLRSVDEVGLARIAERYSLATEPEDASPEPFVQPTLFITGRQDHVVGYRDAWARSAHYPRSTFAMLDLAGHNVHLERYTPTASLVADWLERIRDTD